MVGTARRFSPGLALILMSVSPSCPRAIGRQVGRVYLREVGGYALAVISAMSAAKQRR